MLGHQQALFIGEIVREAEENHTIIQVEILMGEVTEEQLEVEKFNYYGFSQVTIKH